MKKISTILLAISVCSLVQAQKIKMKGDIVYIDKDEVGTIVGEASLVKPANYTLTSPSGKDICTITEGSKIFKHPLVNDIYYYNIIFGDSQKKVTIRTDTRCINAKCLLKKFAAEAELVPTANGISNQDDIISKYDKSEAIAKDTIEGQQIIDKMEELALTSRGFSRDITKPVSFELTSTKTFAYTTTTFRNIIQDGIVIGEIKMEATKSDISGNSTTYWLIKKLSVSETLAGEEKDSIIIGWGEAGGLSVELYIFQSGESVDLTKVPNTYNAYREVTEYFIANKYL